MARCPRCNACESPWYTHACRYCNYPQEDIRTEEEKAEDNKDIERLEQND